MEKTCNNCGTPITKEYCEEGYPNGCDHWTPKKPMTNADRIRAMTDEGLANMVVCPHVKTNWDMCKEDCFACRLEWLQQLAEGE